VAEAKKGHAQLLDQDHEEIEAQMRDRLTKKLNLNAPGLLKKPQTLVTPIECPHCNDTSAKNQQPITDAERNVTGPATVEVRKRKHLNKCARAGVQLSKTIAEANWTPARKFRASLS